MTKHTLQYLGAGLLAALALVPASNAQIPGRIKTKDGATLQGTIRWQPANKQYILARQNNSGASFDTPIPLAQVESVVVAKPQQLDAAIRAVEAGKAAAAIPVLEKIKAAYTMLQWDEPATRCLAAAQLASGDAAGAIKNCESLISVRPELAWKGELAPTYWQALLKTGKTAKLNDYISNAIASGDGLASASALLMRGDIYMDKKEGLNALKEGYLRVVVLYQSIRDIQPEALYKAAKAFESINRNGDAEKLRSELRTKYPNSSYARQL